MLNCASSVQFRDGSSKCFFKETDLKTPDKWHVPNNVNRRMSSMSSPVIEGSLSERKECL